MQINDMENLAYIEKLVLKIIEKLEKRYILTLTITAAHIYGNLKDMK